MPRETITRRKPGGLTIKAGERRKFRISSGCFDAGTSGSWQETSRAQRNTDAESFYRVLCASIKRDDRVHDVILGRCTRGRVRGNSEEISSGYGEGTANTGTGKTVWSLGEVSPSGKRTVEMIESCNCWESLPRHFYCRSSGTNVHKKRRTIPVKCVIESWELHWGLFPFVLDRSKLIPTNEFWPIRSLKWRTSTSRERILFYVLNVEWEFSVRIKVLRNLTGESVRMSPLLCAVANCAAIAVCMRIECLLHATFKFTLHLWIKRKIQ